ncbi:MAG: aminodeoxychorismate/anthranilate synthase component II [Chitinophagales bacterium]
MVLLIDNYDSFTYNLVDYISQLGKQCIVVRNDEKTIEEIDKLNFESIVISPGPCTPAESGITNKLIEKYHTTTPILGICLGHQALGQFFGAELVKANKPMHGKVSKINVNSKHYLFKNLSTEIAVMRYHSLVLKNVVQPIEVLATTKNNEIMAIAHNTLPLAGLQFHPESILSKQGLQILRNWFEYVGGE